MRAFRRDHRPTDDEVVAVARRLFARQRKGDLPPVYCDRGRFRLNIGDIVVPVYLELRFDQAVRLADGADLAGMFAPGRGGWR